MVTAEWAAASGLRADVAKQLIKEKWEIDVLLSSKDCFVQALCDAGEDKGPATKIWLKLQSQGTARSILGVDLMPSLLLALRFSLFPTWPLCPLHMPSFRFESALLAASLVDFAAESTFFCSALFALFVWSRWVLGRVYFWLSLCSPIRLGLQTVLRRSVPPCAFMVHDVVVLSFVLSAFGVRCEEKCRLLLNRVSWLIHLRSYSACFALPSVFFSGVAASSPYGD